MGSEVAKLPFDIDARKFSVAEAIARILPRGHVIHGYSSASNTRLVMVLESKEYSDSAPLLGFGADGNAERALARSLITYALREAQGLDYITENQFPESTKGQVPSGGHSSRFDNIVWGADFWLYQRDCAFVSGSNYGGVNRGGIEVESDTPLGAITALTDTYCFNSPSVRWLPAFSPE